MGFRKEPQITDDYATTDALFVCTLRNLVDQPTPVVWRRTARKAILTRIKKSLLGYPTPQTTRKKRPILHTSMESTSITRWII
jgi:hypothetical protein